MEQIPLWILFFGSLVFAVTAVELGYRLGAYLKSLGRAGDEAAIGTMVQSTLALVAFLLAFTFGIAADRFNERRLLIIDEANSIGTTYLRSSYMPDALKEETQKLLREYVSLRVHHPANPEEMSARFARTDKLQDLLWSGAVRFGKSEMNSDVAALYVDSLNETIDLHSKRVAAAFYARVPQVVWYALYTVIFLGLSSIGYLGGCSSTRSFAATTALAMSFAIVLLLIADLDRSTEGFLKSNLQPIQDLAKKIGAGDN
ncbi:MAG: hypothetical protein K2X27_01715 [Candidatus Obscuribacterales bacterium]|nr:hypothetical protein [Candidatus Obscuribacterales bacterium]